MGHAENPLPESDAVSETIAGAQVVVTITRRHSRITIGTTYTHPATSPTLHRANDSHISNGSITCIIPTHISEDDIFHKSFDLTGFFVR